MTREGRSRNGHAMRPPDVVALLRIRTSPGGKYPSWISRSKNIYITDTLLKSFVILIILPYCGFPQSFQNNADHWGKSFDIFPNNYSKLFRNRSILVGNTWIILSRWPRGTVYSQKLALPSPTRGGRSVGIVRSRTRATEFSLYMNYGGTR
jgi:hypothetical protein